MSKLINSLSSFFSYLSPDNLMITDIVEIIIFALLIYYVIGWIRDTKAWSLLKGLIVLIIIWVIAGIFQFQAIIWIFVNTINVGIIALMIIFQPELRRGLEQLGRKNISLFTFDFKNTNKKFSDKTIQEIVSATFEMAKCKTGALMVIEGESPLGEYESTGIMLNADVTAALLINIFEHNTPLHDGAVIIKNDKITAATCILPVSDNMQLSKELGTRHRAGVGLSEVVDGLIIIVSEETGKVSLARNGQLIRGIDEMYLKSKLSDMQIDRAALNAAKKREAVKKNGLVKKISGNKDSKKKKK